MKRILLLCLTAVFMLATSAAWAQERTVTGRVSSEDDGSAIPGVNVVVKGTTVGTVTDAAGNFSISAPADGTLVFTFIGMASQEVAIANRTSIDVKMAQDVQQLSEVVVTGLGIESDRKALGYAVQDVKSDDLVKGRESNIVNALSGKIAGIQVTGSSGAVGASSRIVIRGASSFGNNQPLFVVDGVPISNNNFGNTDNEGTNRGSGANDINPDDVESVTVLKGPTAAAKYGSRGANGVILITTKSGKKGSGLGIQVNSSVAFENPLKLPDYQNAYGQGSSGAFEYVNGAGAGTNDGVDESWGPKLDAGLEIPQFDSPLDADGHYTPTPWVSRPDNVKDFFETGVNLINSIAINGGGDKSAVRLSYTNQRQTGMVPNTDQKKHTISLNGNVDLTDKFSVNASANFVKTHSDNLPGYGYSAQNVMQQFVWFGRQVDIAALKNYKNADGSKFNWNHNYHNNPYFTLYENLNGVMRDRIYGNAKANYRFNDYLSAFVRTGTDYYTNRNTGRIAVTDLDNPEGSYTEDAYTFSEVNTDFLLTFNKDIATDVNFSLSAGGNQMNQNTQYTFGSADELAVADVYTLNNSKVPLRTSNEIRRRRINSLYTFGQVGYRDALFLDFSYRVDWSSALPAGNNQYGYPAVNVSAVITELAGIESNTLNNLRVKAGYAQVGNDTGPYQLLNYGSFGDAWNAATKLPNMFVPNTLANDQLKPEKSTGWEVGFEAGILDNRVRLDFTYYDKKTEDQIIAIPVSAASGYAAKYVNAGEISNKGIEVILGATPVQMGDFKWDMNVNFATYNNQVVSLAPGVEQYVLGTYWSLQVAAIPGQKFASLYGYGFARDPQGRIIHEDGLPVTETTAKVLGNYAPDWTAGFGNEFSYKGITLSGLIDVKKGGDLYTMTTTWGRYAGVLEETLMGRENGIVGDGVKNIGTEEAPEYVPNDVVVSAEEYNKAAFSNSIAEPSVFDASFVKLREMRLGYTLPNSLFGKTPFRDVSVAFVGRNLALLYSTVPHIDPETAFSNSNVQGLEFGQLPSARTLGFNLSFKLQ
jgi:TonB-linked SusC/RagA family outer membrane protein